jgi:two-component system response regulator AlgR
VKILVVDDEALARERLLRLLSRLEPAAQCWQAADAGEALSLVEQREPDLLLLDIRMPGMSGVELAARLDQLERPPAIIFCTAYDQYALEALQHQAVAYLLKPVREADLSRALAVAGRVNRVQMAALETLAIASGTAAAPASGRSHLSSQTHRGVQTMPVDDVRCLLAEQKYVTACSPSGDLLIPDTLRELEQEFGERFIRVHRNALVARQHIARLERGEDGPWYVVLDGVDQRPLVSRRHLAEVKRRLVQG